MKAASLKKLRSAIDQVYQMESWEMLGETCPGILDKLIGADYSSWNVFDQRGQVIEVFGTTERIPTVCTLIEALNVRMSNHIVAQAETFPQQKVSDSSNPENTPVKKYFGESGFYRGYCQQMDAKYQACSHILSVGGIEVVVSSNRCFKDFGEESLALLGSVKKHLAISCRHLLRERELQERIILLMECRPPVAKVTMTIDQKGNVIDSTGDVNSFLASRFKSVRLGLPISIRRFIKSQDCSIHACSHNFTLDDDFGGHVGVTLLQTGFGSHWSLLFHQGAEVGMPPSEHSMQSFEMLTRRELEVLRWLAEGKTNSEIAILLNVTLRTIEKHCEHIYEKLGVENRISAAREWFEQ